METDTGVYVTVYFLVKHSRVAIYNKRIAVENMLELLSYLHALQGECHVSQYIPQYSQSSIIVHPKYSHTVCNAGIVHTTMLSQVYDLVWTSSVEHTKSDIHQK